MREEGKEGMRVGTNDINGASNAHQTVRAGS